MIRFFVDGRFGIDRMDISGVVRDNRYMLVFQGPACQRGKFCAVVPHRFRHNPSVVCKNSFIDHYVVL